MIESFGIDKANVAKWAGITSAVFSLSQCVTAVMWGRASDKFGRKPAILIGLTCTMFSTLLWGMSTSLPMAITARALAGGCNGNGMLPPFPACGITDPCQWELSAPWWRKWSLNGNCNPEHSPSCHWSGAWDLSLVHHSEASSQSQWKIYLNCLRIVNSWPSSRSPYPTWWPVFCS